ncbi:DUF2894 domain-containing protein [Dechloromonas sp. XY25]|uniref:DUF2894 domain-containing protein n=1 Tax=Dechloromonas hankyongensis TaxID=2908002 RepID=A0ABS9K234_9RHOO|nr:DUF2894 domain-containing protein [Dechloromonas hankyongensis]MCG2577243.1 DUF2894 domain-containing protein [Dechloromonas hankyongensis]
MAELPADSSAEPGSKLAALRESGADRLAPVRFAYLDALARRAAEQPEAIRRVLSTKIAREADALAARHPQPTAAKTGKTKPPAPSPLAELLAYIGEHALAAPPASQPAPSARPAPHPAAQTRHKQASELKSVAYFRATWSKLSTEQQLAQTLAQAPENAGPMNSQHLVLRSLSAMRDHAPDYLQGFMSYIDTLIWLENASPMKPATGEGEKKAKTTKRG